MISDDTLRKQGWKPIGPSDRDSTTENERGSMTTPIYAVFLLLFIAGCCDKSLAERAYFEGQRDAIENDIRVEKRDGVWRWRKTCWDDGTATTFDPSLSE